MSELVERLKHEHAGIIDVLLRVKFLDIRSEDGQEILLQSKDLILSHLREEDDELYPFLRMKSENDKDLRINLDYFQEDMERVTKAALQFYSRYSEESLKKTVPGKRIRGLFAKKTPENKTQEHFAQDFERLYRILVDRIHQEENVLYTAYEKLILAHNRDSS
jgi:hypothetical protein